TVRFSFFPLIGTCAVLPRRNHPALRGGKRSRSVSSSNSLTHPAGKARTFFRSRRSLLLTLGDLASRRVCPGLFHTYFSRCNRRLTVAADGFVPLFFSTCSRSRGMLQFTAK